MIQYSKLQIGCMLIVLYIAFIYFRERDAYKVHKKEIVFELLLFTGMFSITFDGLTAYTVNHINQVPAIVNAVFHACFLCSLDAIVFLIFLYIFAISLFSSTSKHRIIYVHNSFILNIAFTSLPISSAYPDINRL